MLIRKLNEIPIRTTLTDKDSDAIIPAEFMPGSDNADLGSHCFQYFRPEFRDKVTNGSTIM
jgi:homoaconitate hydratase